MVSAGAKGTEAMLLGLILTAVHMEFVLNGFYSEEKQTRIRNIERLVNAALPSTEAPSTAWCPVLVRSSPSAQQGPLELAWVMEARRCPSVHNWSRRVRGPWVAALSHLRDAGPAVSPGSGSGFQLPPHFLQTDRQTRLPGRVALNLIVFQTDNR